MLQMNVELFEHLTSLRMSVESLSDIIEKRCIVFDIRVHCNSALFVCTCVRTLNLIAFSCVFLHFHRAIIGLVLIDVSVSIDNYRVT